MFVKLGHLIGEQVKQHGIQNQVEASNVLEEFEQIIEQIFGKGIEKKAQAKYVRRKVLHVACMSSILATEIKLQEAEIVKKINDKYKKTVVEKIRFLL